MFLQRTVIYYFQMNSWADMAGGFQELRQRLQNVGTVPLSPYLPPQPTSSPPPHPLRTSPPPPHTP